MAAMKTQWRKILYLVLASVFADVILHRLFAPRIEYDFRPSFFVEKGLFLPAATVALIIWFGTLAIVFAFIQDNLPGNRVMKGLRYGAGFAGLCFLAIFEMCLIFDSPVADELRTSTTDAVSLLFLGLLLGRFVGTDSKHFGRQEKVEPVLFIVIPLTFLVGRYFGYSIVHIMSAYKEKPIPTFAWTLAIGLWIGITYWFLKEKSDKPPVVQAVRFGILIFGTYWLIYNLFVLLFVNVSVVDVFVRVIIDVLSVTVGIWVVNELSPKKTTVAGKTTTQQFTTDGLQPPLT
jgi:hypothetical protein